jgi:hypothetical protein
MRVGRPALLTPWRAGELLDQVVAGGIPHVDPKGKMGLGFHGQWLAGIYRPMFLRMRPRPNGFIEPCLPSPAPKPPSGPGWIHEIKHDGFRLIARREGVGVRLFTRRGIDWTGRYERTVLIWC